MTTRRKILLGVAALVALQAVAWGVYRAVEGGRGADFAFEALDRPAPDLALRAPGRSLHLRSLRGKPVLLHFWATWCPPCVDELPGLLDTARELEGELVLVAVSLDDDWAAVEAFFGGSVPGSVWRLRDADAFQRYDVVELPDSFLIDAGGRVRSRYSGERDWDGAAARAHLEDAAAR